MPMIQFEHVSKTYPGSVDAVSDLSMNIAEGETLVLLGTSGCGKTTTMKLINRLEEPSEGRITINGTDIKDQDPFLLRRSIGYAIQHIGLFPHMTVGENIAVVPHLLQWKPEKVSGRIDELLVLVGLQPDEYRDRFPSQLSGGQLQRIGVARALAADPPIILMDEPFGALYPITREQLQNEFLELESILKKTIVFVTHDIFEAVRMGDRIALMDAGRLQQISTPAELVGKPANDFVDQFLGAHRFQLTLLTRSLSSLTLQPVASEQRPEGMAHEMRLYARSSLIEALDNFKNLKCDMLPVYDGTHFLGNLSKEALLSVITEIIGGGEIKS